MVEVDILSVEGHPNQRTHTHTHTHRDCTVKYDGLLHRWMRQWAKSPILDVQTLLHRSHGHSMLTLMTTWRLWAPISSLEWRPVLPQKRRQMPDTSYATVLDRVTWMDAAPLQIVPDSVLISPEWSALWTFAGRKQSIKDLLWNAIVLHADYMADPAELCLQ